MLLNLELKLPIIQAPMAGVATPALAAAVSDAGGLGSLGIGASTVAQARDMIAQAMALTRRAINVNVFCHQPAQRDPQAERRWLDHLAPLFAEYGATPPAHLAEIYPTFLHDDNALRMLLDLRPAVVSFHFGLPSADRIAALKGAGIRLLASATNPAEADQIAAAGLDGIIAQGIEAGGHRGMFDPAAPDECHSTSVLVRLLVQRHNLPVIAAGGIMDGQAIRAALDLGAAAAQLGTAFILCPESAADAAYRALLSGDAAAQTRLTAAVSGRPARSIVTRLIRHADLAGCPTPAAYPVTYDATKRLDALAKQAGNPEFGARWAGQGAPMARAMPAADLMAELAREMAAR